jgi:hypothetical protein
MTAGRRLFLGTCIVLLLVSFLVQPAAYPQRNEMNQNGEPVPSVPTAPQVLSTAGLQPDDSSFFNFWMSKFSNWWISQVDTYWTPFKKWVFRDKENVPDLFIGRQDHFYVNPCPDDPNSKEIEVKPDKPKSEPRPNPFPRKPSRNRIDSFSPLAPRGGGRSSSSSGGSSS